MEYVRNEAQDAFKAAAAKAVALRAIPQEAIRCGAAAAAALAIRRDQERRAPLERDQDRR